MIYNIPKHIAKYSKPLPYFMKYASPYYANMKKLARTQTNMNRLCWEIEKWEKETIKYKRFNKDFNYQIMIDESIELDQSKFDAIENIFLEYSKEMRELSQEQYKFNNYNKYMHWIQSNYPTLSMDEIVGFQFDWQYYYNKYKTMCKNICSDDKELANIVVKLCYEKYSKRDKSFMWRVASEGLIKNLMLHKNQVYLPSLNIEGKYSYLGKRYDLLLMDEGEFIA